MFLKAISSLTGPFNPIFRGPNQGVKFDWEVELVVLAALTLRQRLLEPRQRAARHRCLVRR